MYQMIVVDDEKFSRSVVEKYIRSAQRNFEVAGLFPTERKRLLFLKAVRRMLLLRISKCRKWTGWSCVRAFAPKTGSVKSLS